MKNSLRIFGVLLLVGGIVGTAYFSYFVITEKDRHAKYFQGALADQQEKIKTLEREQQQGGNSKAAQADIEKRYKQALDAYQVSVIAAAESEDFYKRQRLFAIGSGVILVIGLLMSILSFRGPNTKAETVLP